MSEFSLINGWPSIEGQYSPIVGQPFFLYGLHWDDYWDFGAPTIIYSPVLRFGVNGCLEQDIEKLLDDLCIDESVPVGHSSDLHEFRSRGWRLDELLKRDEVNKVVMKVEIVNVSGQKNWNFL